MLISWFSSTALVTSCFDTSCWIYRDCVYNTCRQKDAYRCNDTAGTAHASRSVQHQRQLPLTPGTPSEPQGTSNAHGFLILTDMSGDQAGSLGHVQEQGGVL